MQHQRTHVAIIGAGPAGLLLGHVLAARGVPFVVIEHRVDPDRVNRDGGAIALGHPIGASGARIVGHLALVLAEAPGGTLAAAGLCGGGGQGSAMVLQAL